MSKPGLVCGKEDGCGLTKTNKTYIKELMRSIIHVPNSYEILTDLLRESIKYKKLSKNLKRNKINLAKFIKRGRKTGIRKS